MSALAYHSIFKYRFFIKWIKLFAVTIAVISLLNCEVTFEGGYKNTPIGNFDAFFHELNHSYAYSDYRFEQNRLLSEIENILRSRIVANPSWENLVLVLTDLLDKYIADPHLYSVYSPMKTISNNEHLKLRRNNDAKLIELGYANIEQ